MANDGDAPPAHRAQVCEQFGRWRAGTSAEHSLAAGQLETSDSRFAVCRARTRGLESTASTRGIQLRRPWAALRKRRLPAGVSGRSASSDHLRRSRSNAMA